MLMDDTVIFATSRDTMIEKLKILDEYCEESGMIMNEGKTKFMALNCETTDKLPISLSNISVKHCEQYIYLGVVFTADGRGACSIKAHLTENNKQLNKLLIFLSANYDAPFVVKKHVLEAAFMSSILYGCESWFKVPLKAVESMYMTAVRALLGVKTTTSSQLCLLEIGMPPLLGIVKSRQKEFLNKMMTHRSELEEDPLMHVLYITKEGNKVMWTYLQSVMNGGDFVKEEIERLKRSVLFAKPEQTKLRTYISLNPQLLVHPIYTNELPSVPDSLRITFSRFRLSAHRLPIETGEEGVQDEHHIFKCSLVKDILGKNGQQYSSDERFFEKIGHRKLKLLHDILERLYQCNKNPGKNEA